MCSELSLPMFSFLFVQIENFQSNYHVKELQLSEHCLYKKVITVLIAGFL